MSNPPRYLVLGCMACAILVPACGDDAAPGDSDTRITVGFNVYGGTPAPPAQTLESGATVTRPPDPSRSPFRFDNWYRASAWDVPWDFTQPVSHSFILHARWIYDPVTETLVADGLELPMVRVPGGIRFPVGIDDDDYTATVTNAFWIATTEVRYELWAAVHAWATNEARGAIRYTFPGAGQMGSDPGTATPQHPVTEVTWRAAVTWCNALTEWYNECTGSNLAPVYHYTSGAKTGEPVREWDWGLDPDVDLAIASPGADGFRLPEAHEWELAARWRHDTTNAVSGYVNPWFTRGGSASGANARTGNAAACALVAVYSANSGGTTAPVGSKAPNALGLFDMSGNAWEWIFTDTGTSYQRTQRGGSAADDAENLDLAKVNTWTTTISDQYRGLRVVRSAD